MILVIADIVDADALAAIHAELDAARLRDGRDTAGWHARAVKNNRQAEAADIAGAARQVAQALAAHPVFQAAALPQRLSAILFNRYETGMSYGRHVDDALMGAGPGTGPSAGPRLRTDLAFTLFLDDPATYAGGNLVIETAGDEQAYRLAAGACVLYPALYLHRVEPVTAGVRRAAVGWVQSLVRDPVRREILFDLDAARRDLFDRDGKTASFDRLAKAHANLLRLWAEP